jgi:hypothetical protein
MALRMFHLILMYAGIVLAAGFGMWCFFNHQAVLGVLSFVAAVGLVGYLGYFAKKAEQLHLP